jgi:hypothetical protein
VTSSEGSLLERERERERERGKMRRRAYGGKKRWFCKQKIRDERIDEKES